MAWNDPREIAGEIGGAIAGAGAGVFGAMIGGPVGSAAFGLAGGIAGKELVTQLYDRIFPDKAAGMTALPIIAAAQPEQGQETALQKEAKKEGESLRNAGANMDEKEGPHAAHIRAAGKEQGGPSL